MNRAVVGGGDVAIDFARHDRDGTSDADRAAVAGEREAGDGGRADVDERVAPRRAAELRGGQEDGPRRLEGDVEMMNAGVRAGEGVESAGSPACTSELEK